MPTKVSKVREGSGAPNLQSSLPLVPSFAVKYRSPPKTAWLLGLELPAGVMSETGEAEVPSYY